MSGWRPALRIARREAVRARGRTALVMVMIALPVTAVSAAAVIIKTAEVSGIERADRLLGAADALLLTEGPGRISQSPDPEGGGWGYEETDDSPSTPGVNEITASLGSGRPLIPIATGYASFVLHERRIPVTTTEVDLTDPLARGLFELTDGALPSGPGEVVVNDALLAKGVALGDEIDLDGTEEDPVVVGSGRDATARTAPVVLGPEGSFADTAERAQSWLVGGGEVAWSQVQALNQVGFVVTSRAVLADPPDVTGLEGTTGQPSGGSEMAAIVTLIMVMALLELVLLAGPAFAVGARRQARSLALMVAAGATPRQARRVVLASGVVLGLAASVGGVVLGVVGAGASLRLIQGLSSTWWGPFEVPWGWLAVIALFGLSSAFLASLIPARIASRQDVVAVLAGRRGDLRPSLRSPVLGLVLLGVGIAGSTYGALTSDSGKGSLWIAGCAVISIVGMILVVPVVVSVIARLSAGFPLSARYAARDAARHRTRTVPAVAAVAATVASVVALGIANSSDNAESAATYDPVLPMGSARVEQIFDPELVTNQSEAQARQAARTQWDAAENLAASALPDASVEQFVAMPQKRPDGRYQMLVVRTEQENGRGFRRDLYGGSTVLVGDALPTLVRADLTEQQAADADAALVSGQVVLFASRDVDATSVRVVRESYEAGGDVVSQRFDAVPAYFLKTAEVAPAEVVVPSRLADEWDISPLVSGLMISDADVTLEQEEELEEALGGVVSDLDVYVERGYVLGSETMMLLLVLFGVAGVLMLGGTLTATFLALSDARPDLATLSAVGASPRTRRSVAAAYAVVIGFVGALVGAGVGFIPGIAISRPLTSTSPGGPYLDIPWLMIAGLVVVLPLVTAAVVGLTARSRLPLVARLD